MNAQYWPQWLWAGVLAIGAAVAVPACDGGRPVSFASYSPSPAASAPSVSVAPTGGTPSTAPLQNSVSASPGTAQPQVFAFGDTFTYPDGLKVKVEGPAPFSPSSAAAGVTAGDKAVTFAVTITNGTGKAFDAVLVVVQATAGDAGRQAARIVDFENEVGVGFTGTIAPGTVQTVTFGFGIAEDTVGTVFDVQVLPGVAYTTERWAGSLPP